MAHRSPFTFTSRQGPWATQPVQPLITTTTTKKAHVCRHDGKYTSQPTNHRFDHLTVFNVVSTVDKLGHFVLKLLKVTQDGNS